MRLRALLSAALALLPIAADAQQIYGPLSNCSGTVGAAAAPVVFPSSGTGGPAPTTYFLIQNVSGGQILWVSVVPGVAATTAAPSVQLVVGASLTFYSPTTPVPSTVSVIGSAPGAVYTCWYR